MVLEDTVAKKKGAKQPEKSARADLDSTNRRPHWMSVLLAWVSVPNVRASYYMTARSLVYFQLLICGANCIVNWGYETEAGFTQDTYSWNFLKCDAESDRHREADEASQRRTFWNQADFGYIRKKLKSFVTLCAPRTDDDSFLGCSDHMQFCRARNIVVDFSNLKASTSFERYRENVIKKGQTYGKCSLNEKLMQDMSDQKSPLQSWAAEMGQFVDRDLDKSKCDRIIFEPSIIIKLDAGINMYHHFCDFLNLYATQHMNGSFSKQVQIIAWDTSGSSYYDFFNETWSAFTDKPLIFIKEFDSKKVCFHDVVFSLLARMRYGLYYNTPLVGGCYGSGLFHAFSAHILARLNISCADPLPTKIRITFLTRSTRYRRILNDEEIFGALKTVGEFDVKRVDYDQRQLKFIDQLQITQNTDILLGIHGSGLTHLLFLPDWAAIFEIYNCDDALCYYDLARLRGVKYFTWQKKHKMVQQDEGHHPTLGAHAKFTNYKFDVEEFLRIVYLAAYYVRNHIEFRRRQAKFSNFYIHRDEL